MRSIVAHLISSFPASRRYKIEQFKKIASICNKILDYEFEQIISYNRSQTSPTIVKALEGTNRKSKKNNFLYTMNLYIIK